MQRLRDKLLILIALAVFGGLGFAQADTAQMVDNDLESIAPVEGREWMTE